MMDEQNDDMIMADIDNRRKEALDSEAWDLNDGVEEVRDNFFDYLDEVEKRFGAFESQYLAYDLEESDALFAEDGDNSLENKAQTLAFALQEFSALSAQLAEMVQARVQELRDAFELD